MFLTRTDQEPDALKASPRDTASHQPSPILCLTPGDASTSREKLRAVRVRVSFSEEQSINPEKSEVNLCSEVELLTKLDILIIHGNITGLRGLHLFIFNSR